ncbi:MAG: FAD-dependent monooxygenase [Pseudomonadota bacterium]
MSQPDLIICGGGIAGLTAALCAHHSGLSAVVYERSEILSEVGAGLQLGANAMKVLDRLGLAEVCRTAGHVPASLDLREGRTGDLIFSVSAGATGRKRWGQYHVNIQRPALQQILAKALDERSPGALRLGRETVGYTETETGVDVALSDGTAVAAPALIAADGIHSTLRKTIIGEKKPDYTGHTALRAVVPASPSLKGILPDASTAWTGPERHAVTYFLKDRSLINFVGVIERPEPAPEGWHNTASLEDAQTIFADFADPVRKVLETATEARRWGLYDRPAMDSLASGRMAMIGDAAMPMPPFMAQGASFAIECAWAAISSFARSGHFALMNDTLPKRGARILATARRNGDLFHERGLPTLAKYAPVKAAARMAPGFIRGRFDWIYGFDVTRSHPIIPVKSGEEDRRHHPDRISDET